MSSAWSGAAPTPMFPLGTVLYPHVLIPLRVFEDRYRAMMRDCLAVDGRFGVVLIERGSEVGGGDIRFATGTMASIVQHVELPDGQWLIEVIGTHRIRVIRWVDDAPYPRAMVEDAWESPPSEDAEGLRRDVAAILRRVLALRAELGEPAAPATAEVDGDPELAAWEVAVMAGLGPLDAQRVLDQPGTDERLRLLLTLLTDEAADLAARFGA